MYDKGYSDGKHIAQGKNGRADPDATTHATPKGAVNVGNEICPVSGEKINEETKATYEYEGKIYNFCCVSCIDEFKKDPQKYIQKVEEQLQEKAKESMRHEEEIEMMGDPSMSEGMHEGRH